MKLTTAEKITLLMKRRGIAVAEIAEALGCTVQNVYQKLKRDKWNDRELAAYAKVLGCEAEIMFKDLETGEML